ncbi:MAG: efflux RND transporter periplasmic adaptor subunit [Leptospiraceae bacterium]|nr:efflux RND transporter periplasmic adaptor subunit [Leptospiraceae bacterium]MCP5495938.1 efflux RND transporter periplasmic adaptor subunit [Leptospiraceae bacterium]
MEKRRLFIIVIGVVIVAFVSAILLKKYKQNQSHKSNKTESKDKTNQIVHLDQKLIQELGIRLEKVTQSEFTDTLSLIGEVTANPNKVAKISSRLPGRITGVFFNEGEKVSNGSVLLHIDSPEVSKFRSKYLASLSRFKAIERNAKRLRELVELRLAGEQEAVNAEAELRVLETDLKVDLANLKVLGIPVPSLSELVDHPEITGRIQIRSPMSGVVLNRNAIVGEQVDPTTTLGIIGDLSEIWFMVKLFEKDLSKVGVGNHSIVKLNAYPGEEFEGTLTHIDSQIDATSRTVHARIEIKNKNKMARIGLFGTAEIIQGVQNVISINSQAITLIDGDNFVFVEKEQGKYQARKIKIGRKSNDVVEVLEGLAEGESIVVSGLYTLKSRFLKSTFGEEQ